MLKKLLIFFLMILTFLLGLLIGSNFISSQPEQTQVSAPKTLSWTLQDLSRRGYILINKSSEEKVRIEFVTLTDFLAIADFFKVKTLYYSQDKYGRVYFWYPDPTGHSKGIFRWMSS